MCCNGMCICDENEDGFRYRNRDSRDCDCEPAEVVCLEVSIYRQDIMCDNILLGCNVHVRAQP